MKRLPNRPTCRWGNSGGKLLGWWGLPPTWITTNDCKRSSAEIDNKLEHTAGNTAYVYPVSIDAGKENTDERAMFMIFLKASGHSFPMKLQRPLLCAFQQCMDVKVGIFSISWTLSPTYIKSELFLGEYIIKDLLISQTRGKVITICFIQAMNLAESWPFMWPGCKVAYQVSQKPDPPDMQHIFWCVV